MSAHGKLAWLFALSRIDGKLDDKEAEVLSSFAVRHGLNMDDITAITSNPSQYLSQVPTDASEKRQFFRELWLMVAADGKVADAEARLVGQLGGALGISPDEAADIIAGTV